MHVIGKVCRNYFTLCIFNPVFCHEHGIQTEFKLMCGKLCIVCKLVFIKTAYFEQKLISRSEPSDVINNTTVT